MNDLQKELLELTQRLLASIAEGDWNTYCELCDESLTAYEPESIGQRVEGLAFHDFYFQLGGVKGMYQTTLIDPHVRLMAGSAVVSYIRLEQRLDETRTPVTIGFQETRVWQQIDGNWKHVHFHRSPTPGYWPTRKEPS